MIRKEGWAWNILLLGLGYNNNNEYMSKQDHAQIYEMLSVLFLTVSKGEQVQQCIREVMTSHPLFSPLPLFKYISRNGNTIYRENLLSFLEENKEIATEEEVKVIIEYEAGKKSWQYSDFLEVIYPFNSAVLREINNLHLKRYPKLEKYGVHESTVTGFLMLLTQQISLMRKLEVQKGDSLLKIPKERLRKVLLSIKKAGDRQPSHCLNDDTRITSLQLRNFMKAFVSVEDSHFLYLSRRLGMKNGSFPLEVLERFIKPRPKPSKSVGKQKQYVESKKKSPIRQEEEENQSFNEKSYKQELYEELAQCLQIKQGGKKPRQSSRQGLREKDMNTLHRYAKRQPQQVYYNQDIPSTQRYQPSDNYFQDKPKQEPINSSPKELLLRFVESFLPASRELQALKIKVAQQKIDFLRLFKIIDRGNRGVISAEDLLQFYINEGGSLELGSKEFQLIIERYSQSAQPWLSFTQFCEMVRAEDKEASNKPHSAFGEDAQQLILRILQISVKSELHILKIRRSFRKHESKYLFNLINRQQTGFINYQQLKKFLIDAGLHLSMHDLMAVLKRLDRSRNGVIVEEEFVTYFQPEAGY